MEGFGEVARPAQNPGFTILTQDVLFSCRAQGTPPPRGKRPTFSIIRWTRPGEIAQFRVRIETCLSCPSTFDPKLFTKHVIVEGADRGGSTTEWPSGPSAQNAPFPPRAVVCVMDVRSMRDDALVTHDRPVPDGHVPVVASNCEVVDLCASDRLWVTSSGQFVRTGWTRR